MQVYTALCLFTILILRCDAVPTEHDVVKNLLNKYPAFGQRARPVARNSDNVTVTMGLALISAITEKTSIPKKPQTLKSHFWLSLKWKDSFLTWNPVQYGGVKSIRLRPSDIWIPDIKLYNGITPWAPQDESLVMVSSNGEVLWVPRYVATTYCDGGVHSFVCPLKFGSWTYSGLQVDVVNSAASADLASLIAATHPIPSAPAKRTVQHYPGLKEPYIDVTYKLKFLFKMS